MKNRLLMTPYGPYTSVLLGCQCRQVFPEHPHFFQTAKLVFYSELVLRITGCSEMLMANAASELAAQTPGKDSLAIEAFAKALRQVRLTDLG